MNEQIQEISEREANLKDYEQKFERSQKMKDTLKVFKSTQTDSHPDAPYEITSALPPIFSSQLCHQSPQIRFLANSLPNLSTIAWIKITPEEALRDAAEDALNDQHDRQIAEFYISERDRVRNQREELNNNLMNDT